MIVPEFIADVHLGKLARYLRLLGMDTAYSNTYTNKELISTALKENRVLLSRNAAFSKEQLAFFHIGSEIVEQQLQSVVSQFNLHQYVQPFSRCLICNGLLESVDKASIQQGLKPNTAQFYTDFWQCTLCKHLYWKGAHYKRMKQLIDGLYQDTDDLS